jgi:hypothetical protein
MTRRMRERKTTLNKTDKSGSRQFWKTLGNSRTEDRRRETRKQIIGDILWSYIADKDENRFKGAIMDESRYGLCILTLAPMKVGSVLTIHVKGAEALIDATVIWCKKGFADIYQSGLSFNDNPINHI